jgi:hypothetical protein
MQNDVAHDVGQKCWCGMTWLNANVNTLYVKRISLNTILAFITGDDTYTLEWGFGVVREAVTGSEIEEIVGSGQI